MDEIKNDGAWWSSSRIEPKRKNKFYVEFGTGGILYSVSTVSKPTVVIESKEYRLINHFYKYPGIPKWEDISMKLVDAGFWGGGGASIGDIPVESVRRNTSKTLYEMLLATGYVNQNPNTKSGITETSLPNPSTNPSDPNRLARVVSPEKAAMIDRSFGSTAIASDGAQFRIYQVNGNGKTTETWTLYNPMITKISWGDLDYGDDALVEYSLDIAYDWAELTEEIIKNGE